MQMTEALVPEEAKLITGQVANDILCRTTFPAEDEESPSPAEDEESPSPAEDREPPSPAEETEVSGTQ